ncbi:restriction endonuclease subunit S [Xylella taiwanensis]|uniref:Restriction endonuclease subunit S n=1 Tax=Xylella taiwanensis TaxID=1444770 RepID=A0ABS8TU23_9GAMM|nr:restriction endonuclease subunit S [Xylella taiwanensis]MCD8457685.1 restriction endonuclease subunit S [Xylella taiwanensis]MCD8459822.1 restriction endonuclease subunit S [Xylella taiwanensis]MCD8472609.1 restriction endonuclease subunit S [Xylella taiwanensis]UFN07609.1 restriction endonuclease subunit S [Xylella taiwanensis]UFN09904.1 restriction endonuclease subunit S [Xylella taiwanensis]
MIAALCPEGVEFKTLCEIFDMKAGKFISSNEISKIQDEHFLYPCYGSNGIRGFVRQNNQEGKYILIGRIGALCGNVKRTHGKFFATDNAVVCNGKVEVDMDWAFHLLSVMNLNQYATKAAQPALAVGTLDQVKAPLPPLEVQREIVKMLDTFTQLHAELHAELHARRRQYTYYRDALLTFGERTDVDASIRWMTLGEICKSVSSGGTPLSTRTDYYGGDIPWLRTQEVRYTDILDTEIKITEKGLKESAAKWIPANCVIVAISGATAARSAINKIPLTTNQHCCNLEVDPTQANYRYVFHWVSKEYERLKALGQGARADLNSGIIKSYAIPIPPLEEQARIVAILDRFDALVNDISFGLPAEIQARRQQYAYYRDRLLTFKEAR